MIFLEVSKNITRACTWHVCWNWRKWWRASVD